MVLAPNGMKISRSLRRTLRKGGYEVRFDTSFDQVIDTCASLPRQGQAGTWITPEMREAYKELHRLGFAHSVETWMDGEVAGGLYGIALGRVFFGESMFSLRTDASKIALAHLCAYLQRRDFGIIDCQMETDHLTSLGAATIPRERFCHLVAELAQDGDAPSRWPAEAILNFFLTTNQPD